jgi:hypothetical protein
LPLSSAILILSSHLHPGLPSGLSLSPSKPYTNLCSPHHVPHPPPISSSLIWSWITFNNIQTQNPVTPQMSWII